MHLYLTVSPRMLFVVFEKTHCGQKATHGTEGKDAECFNFNKLFSITEQKWISCNGCAKWAHINCYDHSGNTFVKKNRLCNASKLLNKQKIGKPFA